MAPQANDAQKGGSSSSKKRKDAPQAISSRSDRSQQRRAELNVARTIPAQPPDAALKDGELDLQAFISAHEFEVRSLEQSMATSKASGTSRAFQKVPREMRRRTASHDPKRVPRRLRARAKREMNEDNAPTVESRRRKPRTTRARVRAETAKRLRILAERKKRRKLKEAESGKSKTAVDKESGVVGREPRPKIRRNALNEPPNPPAKFRKRQINKTWLPTHAWHAKRARMTEPKNPMWRFAVPLTPNEKIYRPVHRAQSHRGAVIWDTSYMSTIGLYGNPTGMQRVLRRIGALNDTTWNMTYGTKWKLGTRSWTGLVSKETDEGRRTLGPATILWNPMFQSPAHDQIPELLKKRQVFIRVHPSAFLELFDELLQLVRMETPQLYIEDLRFEVGSIDITGPASTEAIHSVVTPFLMTSWPKSNHADIFKSLGGLPGPGILPSNAILGFSAQDPRLRYPPRKATFTDDPEEEMRLMTLLVAWPEENKLQPHALFDRNARHKAASCLPSQKALNRRRTDSKPGSPLKPTQSDPAIPILILATRTGTGVRSHGSWTLVAPWKCILPFWYSMVHCPLSTGGNPRFGGLNEMRQVSFERGLPWFPADFPGTDAGVDWEAEQRRLRKRAYDKRPKSKRVEWKSLDLGAGRKGEIGDGLACDFEFLFGLGQRDQEHDTPTASSACEDAMDVDKSEKTSSAGEDAMDDGKSEKASPATVTPDISRLLLLKQVTRNDFRMFLQPNDDTTVPHPNAILTVQISILGRGVVGPCARIYRLPLPPATAPTSSDAEVPATMPVESSSSNPPHTLPHSLRAQWLARVPSSSRPERPAKQSKPTKDTDLEIRKRLLAAEVTSQARQFWPQPAPNSTDINSHHPLVPDADDLIGFVTTGAFSLAHGHGVAIGSVAVEKVLEAIKVSQKEGKFCIVRNVGENVGWLARWDWTF